MGVVYAFLVFITVQIFKISKLFTEIVKFSNLHNFYNYKFIAKYMIRHVISTSVHNYIYLLLNNIPVCAVIGAEITFIQVVIEKNLLLDYKI